LAKDEEHIIVGGLKEKLAVYVDRISPMAVSWLTRRVKVVYV
jgi:hypothetical protein